MDEWKVGDPADWGDFAGVPDIPYMGYLNNRNNEKEPPKENFKNDRIYEGKKGLGEEARILYKKFEYKKALYKIDSALEKKPDNAEYWNLKAKILCAMESYKKSEKCFNRSLKLDYSDTVVGNKAHMFKKWAWKFYDENRLEKAMHLCMRAMELVNEHETNEKIEDYEFLKTWIEAKIRLNDFYKEQRKTLKRMGRKNLIILRCGGIYKAQTRFKLEKTDEKNEIIIYVGGEKKGDVSNYDYTEENLVSTAQELKKLPKVSFAEYVCRYKDSHHIARLLKRSELKKYTL